jgi:HTH-type transcriptional regulator / antitoxin HigA
LVSGRKRNRAVFAGTFLMEQSRLKQADLVLVLGSRPQVSDLVNGKRGISKARAKKLTEYFGVSAELFI